MFRQYENFADLQPFKDDWNALAERQNNPLISYEWFSSAAEAFHSNDELKIFCIIQDDRLIAAAPLYKDSRISESYRLQVIGSHILYEPGGFLYTDRKALELLLKQLADSAYPIILNRFLEDSQARTSLQSCHGLLNPIISAGSQFINISGSFEEYQSNLSSRRRSDLRRAFRKAQSSGKISFSIDRMTTSNVSEILQQFYRIEHASWKGKNETSILRNSNMQNFMNRFFQMTTASGQAIAGFLYIDDQPAAGNLSIIQYNRIWTIKIGYDVNFSRASPGILLTHEMIRFGHDNNLSGFEFLGSSEDWIKLWKPQQREYITYLYYPWSIRGLYGLLVDSGRRLMLKVNRLANLNR